MKIIDARGLACPQPVVLARQGLREEAQVVVIVDNETARHNVTGMAEKIGFRVQAENRADGIFLHIVKETGKEPGAAVVAENALPENSAVPAVATGGPLVLTVPSEHMGRGDNELGGILVRTFFHTLGEVEPAPDILVFINSGVKLTVSDSPILDDLRLLADKGKKLLICGTCLNHFAIKDKVAVGEISNMYTIAETWLRASRVISI